MIVLLRSGIYSLAETKQSTKILYLDKTGYALIEPLPFGSMLVLIRRAQQDRQLLSTGNYRLYDVTNEPHLADEPHLELEVGDDQWQGYLLPTGLPDDTHPRRRIIATHELITHHIQNKLAIARPVPLPAVIERNAV